MGQIGAKKKGKVEEVKQKRSKNREYRITNEGRAAEREKKGRRKMIGPVPQGERMRGARRVI